MLMLDYPLRVDLKKIESGCSKFSMKIPNVQSHRLSRLVCLKRYQKYDSLKMRNLNLLNKNWAFKSDLSYLWYFLRFRVIEYLIKKVLVVVNIIQAGLVLASLLAPVRTFWKVLIYKINEALLILKRTPLHFRLEFNSQIKANRGIKKS